MVEVMEEVMVKVQEQVELVEALVEVMEEVMIELQEQAEVVEAKVKEIVFAPEAMGGG